MMMKPRLTTTALGGATLALASLGHAQATAPFTETYSGGTFDVATPVVSGGATWTLTGDAYQVDLNSNGNAITYATFDVPNVPTAPGTVVTVSTDFTITGDSTDTTSVGLILFASDTDTDNTSFYEVIISEPGGFVTPEFVVNEVGAPGTDPDPTDPDAVASTVFSEYEVETFNLAVVTTFISATEASFDITVTGAGGTDGAVISDTVEIPLGTVFGLTGDTFSGSSNAQITFDNFSVSFIPEPTSLALLGLGGLGLLARRRRA